jgi:membrane protein required for colicin V production
MQPLPINPVDIAVVVVVLLSAALAFMRGFVREVLAIFGWIGAALAAVFGFPYLQPFVRLYVESRLLADVAAGVGLFLVGLILFSLLNHAISQRVRRSSVSSVDRSLGFLFGLVRGAFLLCLAWLALAWLMPPDKRPDWLNEARATPLLERGAELIRRAIPGVPAPEDKGDQGRRQAPPAPKEAPDSAGESGYKSDERRALDTLLKSQ